MAKTNKVSFVPGSDLCSFIGIDVNLGDWSKVRLGRQLFLLSLLLCALFIAQLLQLNVQIVFFDLHICVSSAEIQLFTS